MVALSTPSRTAQHKYNTAIRHKGDSQHLVCIGKPGNACTDVGGVMSTCDINAGQLQVLGLEEDGAAAQIKWKRGKQKFERHAYICTCRLQACRQAVKACSGAL